MNGLIFAATVAPPALNVMQAMVRADWNKPDVLGQVLDNMNMFQLFGDKNHDINDVIGAGVSSLALGAAGYTLGRIGDKAIRRGNTAFVTQQEAIRGWATNSKLTNIFGGGASSGGSSSRMMELMMMGNMMNQGLGQVVQAPILSDSAIQAVLK